uniref:Galectin n=1 Tax=Poecilia mexicana TaxID=48701 RepID=A0A3B3YWL9_9TELE
SQDMEVRQISFKVGQILMPQPHKMQDTKFSVNTGIDENDLPVHLNPRFSWEGKNGVQGVRCDLFTYFSLGVNPIFLLILYSLFLLQIIIQFTEAGFVMNLCGGSTFDFPDRLGVKKYFLQLH